MTELALTAMRLGFLILLWILILSIVGALRRDLLVGKRAGAATAPPPARAADTGEQASQQPPKQHPTSLELVEGPQSGTSIELAASPILLGRAQEATLVLVDDYASARHARLFPQGSRWFIEDLGSTNGTYLGESQLTRAQPVDLGQQIRIGKTVMELRA
ncbi:FHA domain-containing protein FhaB/FipA [Zhihengliuella salsuginis]|uniref:FHA domain-containing protein n=1 Tax=Zhihengliuella salsuginis TaxID=578222 RepID=A0ABQ3GKZ1_9MICC|nr:FHA domain-containing protein [Zhihengliuella salsuginis]GHD11211.1 FHA domain-containing protein [Zhihengliuella salsuginis]